jgi:hypothetical protein
MTRYTAATSLVPRLPLERLPIPRIITTLPLPDGMPIVVADDHTGEHVVDGTAKDAKLSVRERMRASTSSLDSVWAHSPCAMPQKMTTRARVSPCSAKSFQ